jgi:hypothetical protein
MKTVPPAAEAALTLEGGPGVQSRPQADVARLYAVYAAIFLVVTLLSGLWLRTVFVAPEVIGGFRFPFALHAHSHVAFFGWTTMAMFAVIAGRLVGNRSTTGLRVHAHLVGVASAAAFVGFLQTGYAASTIALSILHVVLWIAFVFAVWPWLDDFAPLERRFWRGALVFLVIAGLGAMTPGIVMARGIGDLWINQISIKSFLTPFTSGWLLLGVMGAVYAAIERRRCAGWVFWLMAVGVLPSTLLHTTAAPPAAWMTLLGQFGTALVGLAALLFASDVLLSRGAAPLLRVAGAAAAVKGGAEVMVSAGLLMELLASRQVTIAYLHLVLLGLVTPALVATALGVEAAPRRTAAYAAGLALMVGSLGVIGWPALAILVMRVGLDAGVLFKLALAGGALCTVAGIAMLAGCPFWRRAPAAAARPTALAPDPGPVIVATT